MKFLLFTSIIFLTFFAQAQSVTELEKKLQVIDSVYHKQTIYLQTDKEVYKSGETIWYKIYVLSPENKADNFSSQLDVEFLNPAGKLTFLQHLKIKNGTANGSLHFPDTLSEGVYTIRTYTNFQLNFGEDIIFKKNVKIKNPQKQFYSENLLYDAKKAKRNANKLLIEIFPECEYLVDGIQNKFLISVKTKSGKHLDLNCKLIDNKGNIILESKTKNGILEGNFTPSKNKKYYIKLKYKGRTRKIKFPNVSDYKFIISKSEIDGTYLSLKVSTDKLVSKNAKNNFFLACRTSGKTVFIEKLNFNENLEKLIILPRKKLPEGLLTFILFDKNYRKLAEKQIYESKQNLTLFSVKNKTKRDSSFVEISVNKKIKANLCVSLVADFEKSENTDFNIKNYVNLISRSKGIKNTKLTEYQQNTNNPTTSVSTKIERPKYENTDGLKISGKLTKAMFSVPATNKKVSLFVLNKYNQRYLQTTNSKGEFTFGNLNFYDTLDVFIEALSKTGKKIYYINLDERNLPKVNLNLENPDILVKNLKIGKKNYFKNNEFHRRKDTTKRLSTTLHRNADIVIFFDEPDIKSYNNVLQVIASRVPGISENGMSALRGYNSINLSSEPFYLIDDIPSDKSSVASMSPNDVDRVEVLKSAGKSAIYGSRGANGVIAVYTKRGFHTYPGELSTKIIGFHKPKNFEFKSSENTENITLLWNPNFNINANKFDLKIPRLQNTKSLRLLISGISENGELIHFEEIIKID